MLQLIRTYKNEIIFILILIAAWSFVIINGDMT